MCLHARNGRDSLRLERSRQPGRAGSLACPPRLTAAGLEDASVRDRLVYEASQLASFATAATEGVCSCGSQLPDELVAVVDKCARGLEGQVWSAKVYARRPA